MKTRIRAITVGLDINDLYSKCEKMEKLFSTLSKRMADQGIPVDTRRVVFSPFVLRHECDFASFLPKLEACDNILLQAGVRWFCLPVLMSDEFAAREFYSMIPKMITRFERLFVHFSITTHAGISSKALLNVAQTIIDISRLSSNGYDNFRVGVGCNIRPNTPFFPFSFHADSPGFSIAADIIAVCVNIMESLPENTDTSEAFNTLVCAVTEQIRPIEDICRQMAAFDTEFIYKGMDCSLAPYPRGKRSIAYLLEQIAPHLCGDPGTVAATAFLTKMLRAALTKINITPAGFNGVMFSPLEDSYLARSLGRNINIEKLMLYSTVCGCGIDMVPIAGSVTTGELASLIQDVLFLSEIHHKPLGVRVLPVPNRLTNEMTEFNHDFLVNSKILSVEGQGLFKGKIF